MRTAHGGSFVSAAAPIPRKAPFRARRRVPRYVAKGAPTCAVCLHRRRGAMEERELLSSACRKFIAASNAVFLSTEPAEAYFDEDSGTWIHPACAWFDWYAVPIPPEGMNKVHALMRMYSISDGPYHDKGGREGAAVGAGESGVAQRKSLAARKATLRAVTARGNPALVLAEVFGEQFPPLHLAPTPTAEDAVDLMPDEWQWGGAAWTKLVKEWPDFPRAYWLASAYFLQGKIGVEQAARLEQFIRSRVDKPTAEQRRFAESALEWRVTLINLTAEWRESALACRPSQLANLSERGRRVARQLRAARKAITRAHLAEGKEKGYSTVRLADLLHPV